MSTPRSVRRRDARRRRIFALLTALVAVVLLGVVVWALFLRGDSTEEGGPAGTRLEIEPGEVVSETVGDPATFPDDQRDLLVERVRRYVEVATVEPLRTGRPARGLDRLFDAGALAALEGPDGAVMLDEGLPAATGRITAVAQPVGVNALADETGAWVMASARLDLEVKAVTDDGTVRIHRLGELLFVPEGDDWKVTAFDFVVERRGPGVDGGKGQTQ